MKISYRWLREQVATKLGAQALAERLTHAGIEVGAIAPVAPALGQIVVGEVLAVEPHPHANQLKFCKVNAGKNMQLDIVCGAGNVAPGMRVPVALEGALLPNGTTIRAAEIRGKRSQGMLCSAEELGLEESSTGLLDLGNDATPGKPLAAALGLDDVTLEVELTPNRGDCLSVAGLAREIAALTGELLQPVRARKAAVRSKNRISVSLDAQQDSPQYAGRVVEGLNPAAHTPLWMRERLRRSGIRSINPVVDVTNYVMLELGQPMHAFDLASLDGGIRVRHARKGEHLRLLDGRNLELPEGTLVIADGKTVLALAGIMGGESSGVSSSTTSVFLESAWFRPIAISGRARSLGLQTDSSYRFERGVDPQGQVAALERATELLLAIAGGTAGPITLKSVAKHLPRRAPIRLREARIARVLGTELPRAIIETILKRLAMKPRRVKTGWQVVAPAYRFDIEREEDLIEELARVHGYARLPSQLPALRMTPFPVPEGRLGEARLRHALIDREYQEVITYSFVDPGLNKLIDPAQEPAPLLNPIAADMAVMRTSLWPGLIGALRHNLNRQQTRVRLMEVGRCFLPGGAAKYQQDKRVGAIACGTTLAEQWGSPSRPVDFYDLKGDVEALLSLTGNYEAVGFRPESHAALHPGQTARLYSRISGAPIGWVGMMHPKIQSTLDIQYPIGLFEIDLASIQYGSAPIFREISKFPSIRRDLALVVKQETSSELVTETIRKVAGKLLVNLELFDQYYGKGIDSGRKSLAVALTLQDSSRTLKEQEVEALVAGIVEVLGSQLGAQLRR